MHRIFDGPVDYGQTFLGLVNSQPAIQVRLRPSADSKLAWETIQH